MTERGSTVGDDLDGVADAQSRVDAYGDAVATAAVDRAVAELAACRDERDGEGDPERAVDPAERAALETLASRVVEGALPDVDVATSDGVDERAAAETLVALFPEP